VHDADRLAAQDRLAAVTGLTSGRGCHDPLRHDAQPPVMVIARMRCGDSARTDSRSGTRRRVRGARIAQLAHHREVGRATTGVGSSRCSVLAFYRLVITGTVAPQDSGRHVQALCRSYEDRVKRLFHSMRAGGASRAARS
jgi:hypothetical protein